MLGLIYDEAERFRRLIDVSYHLVPRYDITAMGVTTCTNKKNKSAHPIITGIKGRTQMELGKAKYTQLIIVHGKGGFQSVCTRVGEDKCKVKKNALLSTTTRCLLNGCF
jgi:hypothetical protein